MSNHILFLYEAQKSNIVVDRNGNEILIKPNTKGHYMRPVESVPDEFSKQLIAKEDRFFYYHLGVNPVSIVRSLASYIFTSRFSGSSTITQQLVKNLLGNENERNIKNKLVEMLYAVSLELNTSKKDILQMYFDSAYFGNQSEGIVEASKFYFDKNTQSLSTIETLQLLATLNYPADGPRTRRNDERVLALASRFELEIDGQTLADTPDPTYQRKSENIFELFSLYNCETSCKLSIDSNLTSTLREVLKRHLEGPAYESVKNGAIVVIRLDKTKNTNEILAIVGSPYPHVSRDGYQINMATRPRPIGSTSKPFIYAKAFESGARPYTIVEDREYKYDIGTGFAFYPKNYDGKYHGPVTFHYALANSLNVPAVRVLQYVGLENFAEFLREKLDFRPQQELEQYQLSIALGGLEMDLLDLAQYFTIFPNEGILKPLAISENQYPELPMMTQPIIGREAFDSAYAQLVTKVLSDRTTGVDQFGLKSNLNLPTQNYAVKTGTTYDYHDSWTIGYTPDFVVGVWLGNSDNTAMEHLSGSVGAGKIWHDAMNILLNSPYNSSRQFNFDEVVEYWDENTIEYGLWGDDYESIKRLLDYESLVLEPHHGDTLQLEKGMKVPFSASEVARWYVNGALIGTESQITWEPQSEGSFNITAESFDGTIERLTISITARGF
ncbi:MAG: hypothetical protein A3F85_02835 [Candidatus Ryanbacteria bacterium RIFCSPLOWO2_12_FULL_44_26]|nr:MAG: hypothetical protein A3F85_02835 [Candidatus Ryanbacteria bacterium RIFCSPLOWO2_12_FULL_44_26]